MIMMIINRMQGNIFYQFGKFSDKPENDGWLTFPSVSASFLEKLHSDIKKDGLIVEINLKNAAS